MDTQSPGAMFAAMVCARIREFCVARGFSMRALVRKAKLSPAELQLFEAESEDITTDMLDRIATVLDVQRIILCMTPEEHAVVVRSAAEMQLSNDKPQHLVRKRPAKRPSRAQGAA